MLNTTKTNFPCVEIILSTQKYFKNRLNRFRAISVYKDTKATVQTFSMVKLTSCVLNDQVPSQKHQMSSLKRISTISIYGITNLKMLVGFL